jgi:hypothetical protein
MNGVASFDCGFAALRMRVIQSAMGAGRDQETRRSHKKIYLILSAAKPQSKDARSSCSASERR